MTRWTGRCASRGLAVLSLGLLLVLVGVGVGLVIAAGGAGQPGWLRWMGWAFVVLGVVLGFFAWSLSSLELRVEADGVEVRFGRFGWPRRRIPLDLIREVSAGPIEPMEWGGWGYRWVPWQHSTAAVIRRGPGIELALTDGRRFAVTVDDARTGAVEIGYALETARGR